MSHIYPIRIPVVNVNDDNVLLVEWLCEHGKYVKPGEPVCVLETSKASADLEAEYEGILYHIARVNTSISIGESIGFIGPDLKIIEDYLRTTQSDHASEKPTTSLEEHLLQVTPKAQALAQKHQIPLEHIALIGVKGTIKEADVKRYLAEKGDENLVLSERRESLRLPQSLQTRIIEVGEFSRYEQFVIQTLRQTLQRIILTTVEMEIDFTTLHNVIQTLQQQGKMVTIQHGVLWALGQTLPHFPRLISFQNAGKIYRYREVDIAFVVRNQEGKLFTPVIRSIDQLNLYQITAACQTASLRIFRGKITPEELEGACFTVSYVDIPGVSRFTALPGQLQSAILAVTGIQQRIVQTEEGHIEMAPFTIMTLSYDHALCDATYGAEFLQQLGRKIHEISV